MMTQAPAGKTTEAARARFLVAVLVAVCSRIRSLSVRHSAKIVLPASALNTLVICFLAIRCDTLQIPQNETHNPLVGGSNPSGPTMKSITYIGNKWFGSPSIFLALRSNKPDGDCCWGYFCDEEGVVRYSPVQVPRMSWQPNRAGYCNGSVVTRTCSGRFGAASRTRWRT